MVKTDDFEFDIDLLISLLEVRPVLWDKTDDIYDTQRHGEKFTFVLKKTSKLWKMLKETLLVSTDKMHCTAD